MTNKALNLALAIALLCIFTGVNAKDKPLKVNGVEYSVSDDKVVTIKPKEYKYDNKIKGDVVIPATIKVSGEQLEVTTIGRSAFNNYSKVPSITLPHTINKIIENDFTSPYPDKPWDGMFESFIVDPNNKHFTAIDGVLFNKDLTELLCYPHHKKGDSYTIPSSVKRIGNHAFKANRNLKEIVIPNSVVEIGDCAFYLSKIKQITLSENLVSIGKHAFSINALTSIKIPYSVQTIGRGSFTNSSTLVKVTYENEKLIFPPNTFDKCPKFNASSLVYTPPVNLFVSRAQAGAPQDQYKLAQLYESGKGFSSSPADAFYWYKKAADQGNLASQLKVAEFTERGLGTAKNTDTAVEYYSKAALQGERGALLKLGKWHLDGTNVAKDEALAIDYITKSAKKGSPEASSILGNMYYTGTHLLAQDITQALTLFKVSADLYPKDAYLLAGGYYTGNGIKADETLALKYFEHALDRGVKEAKEYFLILQGKSAQNNTNLKYYSIAIDDYTKLIKHNPNEDSYYVNRGYCYINMGTLFYSKAEADCREALRIDPNNSVARGNLSIIENYNNTIAQAKRLYQLSCDANRAKNYQAAINYAQQAIAHDNSKPEYYTIIGHAFYNNNQYNDAIAYYNKALSVDSSYADAQNSIKDAKRQLTLAAVSSALNTFSQSLTTYMQATTTSTNSSYSSTPSYNSTPSYQKATPSKVFCHVCEDRVSGGSIISTQYLLGSSSGGANLKSNGKCAICKGTGYVHDGKCSTCNGTGRCPKCNGTGQLDR